MQTKFRLDAQTAKRSFQLMVLLMAFACSSFGTSIKFTDVTTASGTIGSTSFTNAQITITGIGNTSNIMSLAQGFFINDSSASVTISGLGTFQFTTGTRFFVNNLNQTVGFSRAGALGADLIDGPTNSAFTSWSMLTSIGPITGGGVIRQWSGNMLPAVVTTGGILVLNNATPSVTFSARTVVPEPGTLLLFGTGLLSVVGAVRRKSLG